MVPTLSLSNIADELVRIHGREIGRSEAKQRRVLRHVGVENQPDSNKSKISVGEGRLAGFAAQLGVLRRIANTQCTANRCEGLSTPLLRVTTLRLSLGFLPCTAKSTACSMEGDSCLHLHHH